MTVRRLRSSVQVRTRPDFAVLISPQRSRVWTCFMKDGRVIDADRASSPTLAGACPNLPTTARRVGSANAANTASSDDKYCATKLSVVVLTNVRKQWPGRGALRLAAAHSPVAGSRPTTCTT